MTEEAPLEESEDEFLPWLQRLSQPLLVRGSALWGIRAAAP